MFSNVFTFSSGESDKIQKENTLTSISKQNISSSISQHFLVFLKENAFVPLEEPQWIILEHDGNTVP